MADLSIIGEAARRLKQIAEAQGDSEVRVRIAVEHRCHCGGARYGITLSHQREGDRAARVSGVPLLVAADADSEPGSVTVEWVQTPFSAGFIVSNSEHACGSHRNKVQASRP